ncbi:MAG: hypothetical protein WAL75_11930 [Terracidiphilus sp.]
MELTALYRPVGSNELALIRECGWRAFPPRLPEQPIFYPVLNEEYATQIARDWNTRNGGTGYVLRFEVETEYLKQFPIRTAGSRIHQEYWIPADQLTEFNRHIAGLIEVVSKFRGPLADPVE